jgi:hypothetical protein
MHTKFVLGNLKGRELRRVGVDRMITLKLLKQKRNGSEQGPMGGGDFCEHGYEPSDSVKTGEVLEKLRSSCTRKNSERRE